MSELREELVLRYMAGQSMGELCTSFGVSRKTGYKWVERYRSLGRPGLEDRSRAAHRHGHSTNPRLVEMLVSLKKRHPKWGPRKLLAILRREYPHELWPADSTGSDLLKRHGLVRPRRKRRTVGSFEFPFQGCDAPNDVWAMDFKGDFRVGNGYRCLPFTLQDSYSRMALRAEGVSQGDEKTIRPILESTFEQYGLPRAIRSDNGPPFATTAPAGLSRLSIWLLKLGVLPERIEPGKPQQNGRLERFHLTLLHEAISPPAYSLRAQQAAFDRFLYEYNETRPHEALGQLPPAEVYAPSERRFPCPVTTFDYGDAELRKVRRDGTIKWLGRIPYITETLRHEVIGLHMVEPDLWRVRFGPLSLGHIHPNHQFRRIPVSQARLKHPPEVSPMHLD